MRRKIVTSINDSRIQIDFKDMSDPPSDVEYAELLKYETLYKHAPDLLDIVNQFVTAEADFNSMKANKENPTEQTFVAKVLEILKKINRPALDSGKQGE